MMILKGDCGKSRVIDILMNKTKSICFVYNDYPLIFNAIGLDSREYSLRDFLDYIACTLKKETINDRHYHYLLIYTNREEIDLQEIINWLNDNKWKIPCRDIILTCI